MRESACKDFIVEYLYGSWGGWEVFLDDVRNLGEVEVGFINICFFFQDFSLDLSDKLW